MGSSQLALFGGPKVVSSPWPTANTIGSEEKQAVMKVLDSGVLSGFRGVAGPEFLGGPAVKHLEQHWADYFDVKHAVSFNSLTSGLVAAIGALGIGPGDEVIVPPFTMQASATCVLMYGAVPVFADVDPETCCIDPVSVERLITSNTRAIVVVHLFGHPADMDAIMALSQRYNLKVIEDAAQAPGGRYKNKWVGGIGDIGGFSLNYHKTIHCGEGGVMVTNDDDLATRLQLIRNHGEAAVADMGIENLVNTFGGNTRMTELEAAVANTQLSKLERLTLPRIALAEHLDRSVAEIPAIQPLRRLYDHSRHVYYFYAMEFDEVAAGLERSHFVEAVRAEGIELRAGYIKPIYLEPLFQKRVAYPGGFPFTYSGQPVKVDYSAGICPVTERLYEKSLIFGKFCRVPLKGEHVEQLAAAFIKVLENADELREKGAVA